MTTTVIATRVFTEQDQRRFAALSGDFNPMHMDKIAARRTQPGAPVVHGVHLTLWALETLIRDGLVVGPVAGIEATFVKFVYLDTATELTLTGRDGDALELSVIAGGVATTSLVVRFGASDATAVGVTDYLDARTDGSTPNAPGLPDMAGKTGWMPPEGDAAAMFPAASHALGQGRIAAVALCSRLVGMLYPGLHSVFGSLTTSFAPMGDRPGIGFRVATANARTRMLKMDVAGSGVVGTVIAFARREAVAQAGMEQVAAAMRS